MPIDFQKYNVNWYQYVNDNQHYRMVIKNQLSSVYKNNPSAKTLSNLIPQLQLSRLIDLFDKLNEIITGQFMMIEMCGYRQMIYSKHQSENDYETFLSDLFKSIYQKWPHNCPLPKINRKIEYQNKISIDFRSQYNPQQHIPKNIIQSTYIYPVSFASLLQKLERDHIYESKLYVMLKQTSPSIGYSKIVDTILTSPYQIPSKQTIYKALKETLKLTHQNRDTVNEYSYVLIELLLLYKYQKRLKSTLWQWFNHHNSQQFDRHFIQYLKNYYGIVAK